jgi:putative membrane protein
MMGRALPDVQKPLAGQAIHYAVGIALGAAYGIAAEFRPSITKSYGLVFGLGTATLLDEVAVPATGLGSTPWSAGLANNLYSYTSHLVFGGVSEIVRRQVAGKLVPRSSG